MNKHGHRRPARSTRPTRPDDARNVACAVLDEHRRTGRFVASILDEHARKLSAEDRRFAVELVHGVVRRRSTLDAILAPHLRRPRENVEDRLWTILQLGAYQLVLLQGVATHAAVHETVELARSAGKTRWAGFVNGMLRAVARSVTDQSAELPAADAVPLGRGDHRRLASPVFRAPEADPVAYFSQAFSFPDWLVRRWMERYAFDRLLKLGFRFDGSPEIVLRVNRLRTTRDEFLARLRSAGTEAEAGTHPAAVRLTGPARIDALPGYADGDFSVQDESAMSVCDLLAPRPGETVLDLCAAPGTKTTGLAELMENQGMVLATDVGGERLAMVEENRRRLQLANIATRIIERDGRDIPAGPFDAILIDAPCSNTGVLGKRPEARWRLKLDDLRELPALQQRLLNAALERLKPSGRIVYSTCSIEPEENEEVVRSVLRNRTGFRVVEEHSAFPGEPADGGYRCLIRFAD